jgi:hypothetical protein
MSIRYEGVVETLEFYKKARKNVLYINRWETGYQVLEFDSHESAKKFAEGDRRGGLVPVDAVLAYKR